MTFEAGDIFRHICHVVPRQPAPHPPTPGLAGNPVHLSAVGGNDLLCLCRSSGICMYSSEPSDFTMALPQIMGCLETNPGALLQRVWCSRTFEILSASVLLSSLGLSGWQGTETASIKELLIRIQRHPKEIRAGWQRSLRKGWNHEPKCSRSPLSFPASPLSPSYFLGV